MMKKLTYVLVFSLGLTSVHAAEDVFAPVRANAASELVIPAEFQEAQVTQQERTGALAWVKEHKILTAAIVATLLGGAVAGTLIFSPSARQKTKNAFVTAKDGVTSAAQSSWTYCCDHKMISIPVAVVSVLVLGLATYDLCHDSQDSYIKSFIKWLLGNKEDDDVCELA